MTDYDDYIHKTDYSSFVMITLCPVRMTLYQKMIILCPNKGDILLNVYITLVRHDFIDLVAKTHAHPDTGPMDDAFLCNCNERSPGKITSFCHAAVT